MGTRSEIIIKDYGTYNYDGVKKKYNYKVKLYHHYDGYPEGVGKFLYEKVLPILQSSNPDIDRIVNFLLKNEEDNTYEYTVYNHVDIQYQYVIDIPKKKIECYSGNYSNWESPTTRFKKEKEYDLEKMFEKISVYS